ncbi:hypothetical protein MKS88_003901 [Plasmodium brasilianum]|uniref:Uncharacterized protein n=2 Tax=Plasmodium (Plasmodium) TaxID=418103 RepID=A0A1C3KZY1_PLAMA|nr:conserved Plasmodium protein, unknown function [Plasmodium malariae]KAI4837427.1 hypothetical protein MKS88_003901 [Plasmodium brasilianum]SBT79844.1 conserved Plasmodium protein, unknown function [Plasmodium malariae]SCO93311.1 conserved Plasmodium protein, unknown function [Plasmodium malariae]
MDLAVLKNDKNLSFSSINKIVDDIYNDNLNFLLKKNKNELERKEIDQFSYNIEALLNSLDEEGLRLHEERNKMKETFQTIAQQLKNVKKSIKKTEQYIEKKVSGELFEDSHKTFEAIKKDIDNL